MLQFQVGEKAVYPRQGVTEVVGIETKEIGGKLVTFYVLQPEDKRQRILVPADKALEAGVRKVASNSEVEEVFDILRDKEVRLDKQTWNRRYRGFMEKIKTGSLFEVAEVYRDLYRLKLYRLKESKTLSFGERKMLEDARTLIVRELSVACKWTEQKAEKEIDRVFSA